MDGTLLEKKYDLVGRIEALEQGGSAPTYIPGDAIAFYPEDEGYSVNVKIQPSGGLQLDSNGQLYVDKPSMIDQNNYNFNANTPTQIGRVIKGQNVYPLYRVFAEPAYALYTPEAQEITVNFLSSNVINYPLDERAINIKFFAGDIDVTNTFEFGRIGLNGSSYLQSFSCHMATRVQITRIMVEYYDTSANLTESAKTATSKKKTSK